MTYDFRKVQRAMAEAGQTLDDVSRLTGLHKGTLSRIFKTNHANQTNALKIVNAFRLSMKDILPRERKTA